MNIQESPFLNHSTENEIISIKEFKQVIIQPLIQGEPLSIFKNFSPSETTVTRVLQGANAVETESLNFEEKDDESLLCEGSNRYWENEIAKEIFAREELSNHTEAVSIDLTMDEKDLDHSFLSAEEMSQIQHEARDNLEEITLFSNGKQAIDDQVLTLESARENQSINFVIAIERRRKEILKSIDSPCTTPVPSTLASNLKDQNNLLGEDEEWDNIFKLIDRGGEKNDLLIKAIISHREHIAYKLIGLGANINYAPLYHNENTLLHIYSRSKTDLSSLLKFLEYPNININCKNGCDDTPLALAVRCHNFEACKVLIQHGANVNEICRDQTPLSLAVKNLDQVDLQTRSDRREIIRLLIEQGANVNEIIKTKISESPTFFIEETILHFIMTKIGEVQNTSCFSPNILNNLNIIAYMLFKHGARCSREECENFDELKKDLYDKFLLEHAFPARMPLHPVPVHTNAPENLVDLAHIEDIEHPQNKVVLSLSKEEQKITEEFTIKIIRRICSYLRLNSPLLYQNRALKNGVWRLDSSEIDMKPFLREIFQDILKDSHRLRSKIAILAGCLNVLHIPRTIKNCSPFTPQETQSVKAWNLLMELHMRSAWDYYSLSISTHSCHVPTFLKIKLAELEKWSRDVLKFLETKQFCPSLISANTPLFMLKSFGKKGLRMSAYRAVFDARGMLVKLFKLSEKDERLELQKLLGADFQYITSDNLLSSTHCLNILNSLKQQLDNNKPSFLLVNEAEEKADAEHSIECEDDSDIDDEIIEEMPTNLKRKLEDPLSFQRSKKGKNISRFGV